MQEFSDSLRQPFIDWIHCNWGLEVINHDRGQDIQGSPERAISRIVFQDRESRSFLIEKFSRERHALRQRVALTLEFLNQRGLNEALMPEKTKKGDFLPFFRDDCFQVTPFISGTPIHRPGYLSSLEVGKQFARFLSRMAGASVGISRVLFFPGFSIKTYIYKLFDDMKQHDEPVYHRFIPFLKILETGFMQAHDQLPETFCHGDLHPLNVIWEKEAVKAVIDWEFTGIKPECYDAANVVGCAGIENPNGLGMPMVRTFLGEILKTGMLSEISRRFFPEYVLALRFAWLSEWLRKKDEAMIEMEEAYMRILTDHMEEIRDEWQMT